MSLNLTPFVLLSFICDEPYTYILAARLIPLTFYFHFMLYSVIQQGGLKKETLKATLITM